MIDKASPLSFTGKYIIIGSNKDMSKINRLLDLKNDNILHACFDTTELYPNININKSKFIVCRTRRNDFFPEKHIYCTEGDVKQLEEYGKAVEEELDKNNTSFDGPILKVLSIISKIKIEDYVKPFPVIILDAKKVLNAIKKNCFDEVNGVITDKK